MVSTREDVGQLVVSVQRDGGLSQHLWIVRADDTVLVSELLLEQLADGRGAPGVSYGDGILTIRAKNGTVSYGIGAPLHDKRARVGHKSLVPDENEGPAESSDPTPSSRKR